MALFAVILLIAASLLPVGRTGLALPPGPAPAAPAGSRCLALTYTGVTGADLRILPTRIELTPESLFTSGRRTVYRARGDSDLEWMPASWSYAGQDSIDITGHHFPVLRLPISAPVGIGRGVRYIDGTLLQAVLEWHPLSFSVTTSAIPCSEAQGSRVPPN